MGIYVAGPPGFESPNHRLRRLEQCYGKLLSIGLRQDEVVSLGSYIKLNTTKGSPRELKEYVDELDTLEGSLMH